MQFNIHTHKISKNSILNLRIGVNDNGIDSIRSIDSVNYFSAGIHPWDIERIDVPINLLQLNDYLKQGNCISLGEIGLDKVCGTNLEYQKKVFREQLDTAQDYTKVLIIHCVKSFQEIIEEKQNCKHQYIWILHGFNGSAQLIETLTKHGFYFSLGTNLLNSKAKISSSISSIPLDRLFLETDESDIGIDVIYKKAAKLLNIDLTQIETQIEANLHHVFGIDFSKT